jgi:hypothetical protein
MRKAIAIALLFCSLSAGAQSRYDDGPWRFYLEFDQMFVLKFGAEYSLSPHWGVKAGFGCSVFGPTTMGYELVGVYHIMDEQDRFQWDVEFGLPIAYFNVFEGNVVDWDPMVDDPFAGWGPGASLVWGYRFAGGSVLSLKTGGLVVLEYQRDSGWRAEPLFLPEFALQWVW